MVASSFLWVFLTVSTFCKEFLQLKLTLKNQNISALRSANKNATKYHNKLVKVKRVTANIENWSCAGTALWREDKIIVPLAVRLRVAFEEVARAKRRSAVYADKVFRMPEPTDGCHNLHSGATYYIWWVSNWKCEWCTQSRCGKCMYENACFSMLAQVGWFPPNELLHFVLFLYCAHSALRFKLRRSCLTHSSHVFFCLPVFGPDTSKLLQVDTWSSQYLYASHYMKDDVTWKRMRFGHKMGELSGPHNCSGSQKMHENCTTNVENNVEN